MDSLAIPTALRLRGEVRAPSSKSATNRALVLAALSDSPVEILRPLDAADTRALARCLTAMGARIGATGEGDALRVCGPLGSGGAEEIVLDAGESGTAARFLAAIACATPGRFLLTGARRLCERPMSGLVAALRSAGGEIAAGEGDRLPLSIRGGRMRGGVLEVDAGLSSQFVSALLLAGVALDGGVEVLPTGLFPSAPYVGATLDLLKTFGHRVSAGRGLRVSRGDGAPARYEVPGDYSSAVALLACAGVVEGEVAVTGLTWPSRDADVEALPCMEAMGMTILRQPGRITARSGGVLSPLAAEASDFPDSVPVLAALAAFAPGTSRIGGLAHLRGKESDRVASVSALLTAAGISVGVEEDALVIEGIAVARGARLPTAGDHRLVMAAALIALRLPDTLVERPGDVGKSYPRFFADLESLIVRR